MESLKITEETPKEASNESESLIEKAFQAIENGMSTVLYTTKITFIITDIINQLTYYCKYSFYFLLLYISPLYCRSFQILFK